MSLPTIPNITPQVTLNRCETINMLLSSIAMEEIGLSHILNAEGEKLQSILKYVCNLDDYLKINGSVNQTLQTIVKSQILLQFKLKDVISLSENTHCDHTSCKHPIPHHHCPKCKKKKPCHCEKSLE